MLKIDKNNGGLVLIVNWMGFITYIPMFPRIGRYENFCWNLDGDRAYSELVPRLMNAQKYEEYQVDVIPPYDAAHDVRNWRVDV